MTTLFYQIVNPANRITKIRLLKQYNTKNKKNLRMTFLRNEDRYMTQLNKVYKLIP